MNTIEKRVVNDRESRALDLFNIIDENFKIKIREVYNDELHKDFSIIEKSYILGTTLCLKYNINTAVTTITARMILEEKIK